MAGVLIAVFVVLFIGFLFYACLIYPIQALIHCVRNTELTDTQKVLWVLAIFFIWPIAAFFYAAKHKNKVSLLRTSLAVGGFVLILIGGLYYTGFKLNSEMKGEVAKIDVKGASRQLASKDAQFMEKSVSEVQSDLQNGSFLDFSKKSISLQLFDLLKIYTKDGLINASEFKNWQNLFGLRDKLDEEKLKEFVNKEKYKAFDNPKPTSNPSSNAETDGKTSKVQDRVLTPEERRELAGQMENLVTELEKLEKSLPSKEELEKAQKALKALETLGN